MTRLQPLRSRRGSTLPLTILVIALLTLATLAGLLRLSAERRTAADGRAEVDALALAEAGIARYAALVTSPPGASLDTVLTGLPGGTDSIFVRRVRPSAPGVTALYVIVSSAVLPSARRYDAVTPPARRIVAQFAAWTPGTMEVQGAWTSITGLTKHGGSGTISGFDQCGVAPPVPGVTVPVTAPGGNPGYDQNGGSSVPTGSPPIRYPAARSDSVAAAIPIDWDGIVNRGALHATYSLTGGAGWPSSFTDWPVILVRTSSLSLGPGSSGRGLLVVTGNLSLSGSFDWDGVILVGGTLTSNGNNTVQGAVVTGLNVKLGLAVPVSDVGNGNKTFQYNSCYVASALSGLGALGVIRNARLDNWPAY